VGRCVSQGAGVHSLSPRGPIVVMDTSFAGNTVLSHRDDHAIGGKHFYFIFIFISYFIFFGQRRQRPPPVLADMA
jgi:hypothetical protein